MQIGKLYQKNLLNFTITDISMCLFMIKLNVILSYAQLN